MDHVYDAIRKSCLPSLTESDAAASHSSDPFTEEMSFRTSMASDLLMEKKKFREEIRSVIAGVHLGKSTHDQILECYLRLNKLWRQLGINILSFLAMMNAPQVQENAALDIPFEDICLSIGTRLSDALVSNAPGDQFLATKSSKGFSRRTSASSQLPAIHRNHTDEGRYDDTVDVEPSDSGNSETTDMLCQMTHSDDTMDPAPFFSVEDEHEQFPPSPFDGTGMESGWIKERSSGEEADCAVSIHGHTIQRVRSATFLEMGSDGDEEVTIKSTASMTKLSELCNDNEDDPDSELMAIQKRSNSFTLSAEGNRLIDALDRRLNFGHALGRSDSWTEGEDNPLPFAMMIGPLPSRGSAKRPRTPGSRTPLPGIEIRLSCRSLIPLGTKYPSSIKTFCPGNDDLVIPVFDAEPTSIIAHVLSSIRYHRDLQQSFEYLAMHPTHTKSNTAEVSSAAFICFIPF